MQNNSVTPATSAWRLQDAKAHFSAVVDNALRGVPQHVTRRGKQAVVVVSEQDFEALQRHAAGKPPVPVCFIQHLLAIPKQPEVQPEPPSLDLTPRTIDFS